MDVLLADQMYALRAKTPEAAGCEPVAPRLSFAASNEISPAFAGLSRNRLW
jgi:hypothetical protein